MPKKSGAPIKREKAAGGVAKPRKKGEPTFNSYIYKVLKQVAPDIGISSKSMGIMNGFVMTQLERLGDASTMVARAGKKSTLQVRHVQAATGMLLPGELSKHAVSEGTKAVTKFASN